MSGRVSLTARGRTLAHSKPCCYREKAENHDLAGPVMSLSGLSLP